MNKALKFNTVNVEPTTSSPDGLYATKEGGDAFNLALVNNGSVRRLRSGSSESTFFQVLTPSDYMLSSGYYSSYGYYADYSNFSNIMIKFEKKGILKIRTKTNVSSPYYVFSVDSPANFPVSVPAAESPIVLNRYTLPRYNQYEAQVTKTGLTQIVFGCSVADFNSNVIEITFESFDYRRESALEYLPSLAEKDVIFFAGDSLTDNIVGNPPWPTLLWQLLGKRYTMINRALSGTKIADMVSSGGGKTLRTTQSATIPASGTVTISVDVPNAIANAWGLNDPCYIAGIKGSLVNAGNGNGNFTRTESGDAVYVPKGTSVILHSARAWNNAIKIIWAMTNDVQPTTQELRDLYLGQFKAYAKSSFTNRYIIMSSHVVTNDEFERMCENEFGNKFFNTRKFLQERAMDEVGLTPTADDLADIAGGGTPRSLSIAPGNVHLNAYADKAITIAIRERLFELGYVSEWGLDKGVI